MKKIIWIFSLTMLLFSTFAPGLTYATWEVVDNNLNNNENVNSDVGVFVDNDTDNLVDNTINESDFLVSQLGLTDSLSPFDEPEITTLETTHDYLERCFPWYDYNSYWTLSLYNYVCEDTDVIIPVSESWDNKYTVIMENAFVWKTITSIQFPENVTVRNAAFSWAILDGTITIWKNVNLSSPDWWIIWEHGHLIVNKQIYNVYRIVVNWTFTYDITDYKASYNIPQMSVNEFLDKSLINWTVNLVWFDSINRSFSNSEITENWIINIWEWVTSISEYSFWWELYDNSSDSLINWTINFPESLTTIQWSFNYSTINSELHFPESLKNIQSSFYYSNILKDINFAWNGDDELFIIDSSFGYSNIWGLEFSWLNISLNNVSPLTISWNLSFINSRFTYFYNFLTIWDQDHIILWDVNFINTDLYLNWWLFFNTSVVVWDFNMSWNSIILSSNIPVGLKLWGNLNITWNNLIMPWFAYSEITWNVNINAWTMNLQYWLNNSKIKWNVSIIGDDITAKYWSLNNLSISWDFLMSWNYLDLQTDVLNGLKIDWNFEIKWGLLKAYYGVLNGLNVYWDIKLPRNSEFWAGTLWWVIAKWNYIIWYETTVSIWDSVNNAQLSNDVKIVADEIESSEINANDDKIVIQNSEIVATSWMVVEYEWWLKVNFQDNLSSDIEWTARFSDPIAVKVPVKNINNNFVKVMVKHQWDEDFWFTGLTLSQQNVCDDWIPTSNPYNWEDVAVEENNGERYAVIYTCSASTFVAYTENEKKIENNTNENVSNNTSSSSVWGWSTIGVKSNNTVKEQEHNSADTEKTTEKENNNIQSSNKTETTLVEQKVRMVWWKSLTRWEVAVMTNILLEVYPQLFEGKTELDDVTRACTSYADEQNFTKDEKKAITRLCKLSIMWIHRDNNEPLDEFMVRQMASNDEFATVMDRVVANYNEKDLSVVKDALKKLEWDEENVVFGTVYDVFMSIKNIFG